MNTKYVIISTLITALMIIVTPAVSADKFALVIGNETYNNYAPLATAVNDANLIGETLETLGFTVDYKYNLGTEGLGSSIGDLIQKSKPGDITFLYFAGHGAYFDGTTALFGVDVPPLTGRLEDLPQVVRLVDFMTIAARQPGTHIVVLDSSRVYLPADDRRGMEDGYAPNSRRVRIMNSLQVKKIDDQKPNLVVFYATAEGGVPYGTLGSVSAANGPLASALSRELLVKDRLVDALGRVVDDISSAARAAGVVQVPSYFSAGPSVKDFLISE